MPKGADEEKERGAGRGMAYNPTLSNPLPVSPGLLQP